MKTESLPTPVSGDIDITTSMPGLVDTRQTLSLFTRTTRIVGKIMLGLAGLVLGILAGLIIGAMTGLIDLSC